jgi:gp32 DNA binding protein like
MTLNCTQHTPYSNKMNFKDLKKNKSSLSELQKKLETTTSFGTKDERIWAPERDKAGNGFAVIRFLPPCAGEDMPFVKLYTHGFEGPGGWYIENSLTTLGQQDPIAELNRDLWRSGDEDLKKQASKQKRKLNYYSNIYVISDPSNPDNEGKVFLFRYGKKIYDKIMDAVNGDELEKRAGFNPFDLWEGADFKLRVKKVEGYPNYDSSAFDAPSVLCGLDDAQLESIWNREYPLEPIVSEDKFKSYDELKKQLDRALGRSGSVTPSAPTPERVVATKPTFNNAPDPVDEAQPEPEYVEGEDDDEADVMDYFAKLAKE